MLNRPFHASVAALTLFAGLLSTSGCHAQTGAKLSPEMVRRIQITVRTRAALPFNYDVRVGDARAGTLPGYDEVPVYLSQDGKEEREISFLLSKDRKSLAQLNTFDISKDPRTITSDAGRPSRGGGAQAPVVIVGYDDLECPFCAKMHAQLFPALQQRYGDKVRIVYKDFPLSQHPWAVHAAVDADCLGTESATGYWNVVDYVHAHSSEIGGQEKSLTSAKIQLDKIIIDEGARQKIDMGKLNACIAKQDETPVNESLHEAEGLRVEGVPALFINGEQVSGAVPVEFVYRAIDRALVAQGITPPAPVPVPIMSGDNAPTAPPAR